jgi:hypothetical protein
MRRRLMVLVVALSLALGIVWGSQPVNQAGIVWGDHQRAGIVWGDRS